MIIGLVGKAGSGKTTVANYLVFKYGFTRVGFADALRDWVGIMVPEVINHPKPTPPKLRRLLQVAGTELMRKYDPNHWIKQWQKRTVHLTNVVCDDVRFINEMLTIQKDGVVWHITRPAVGLTGAAGMHSSEISLDGVAFTTVIENDCDKNQLYELVDKEMERLEISPCS